MDFYLRQVGWGKVGKWMPYKALRPAGCEFAGCSVEIPAEFSSARIVTEEFLPAYAAWNEGNKINEKNFSSSGFDFCHGGRFFRHDDL